MGNNIRGGKMQRIQLIALDLDGTLLNDSKEVSNESTDAVRKLISRGIYVVPTSGRSSNDELFVEKLKPLGIKYFIGENGGIIKDCMDQKNIRVVSMNLICLLYTSPSPRDRG